MPKDVKTRLIEKDHGYVILNYVRETNEELTDKTTLQKSGLTQQEITNELAQQLQARDNQLNTPAPLSQPKTNQETKVSIFSVFGSVFTWPIAFLTGVVVFQLPVLIGAVVTLIYINFDVNFANSLAFLILGVAPFLITFLIFFTKLFYQISKRLSFGTTPEKVKKIAVKFWLIIFSVNAVISGLITGVGVGLTYKDGYLDYALNQKYQYEQELLHFSGADFTAEDWSGKIIIDEEITPEALQEYLVTNAGKLSYQSSLYYHQVVTGFDPSKPVTNLESFKIVRKYNFRQSFLMENRYIWLKVTFVDGTDEIQDLCLMLAPLKWYNYPMVWQPETIEFIYQYNN